MKKIKIFCKIFIILILWEVATYARIVEANEIFMKKDKIRLNFNLKKVFSPYFLKKMKTGITQKLIFKIKITKKKKHSKNFLIMKYCLVTYDLWDEAYFVDCNLNGVKSKKNIKKKRQLLKFINSFNNIKNQKNFFKKNETYKLKFSFMLNPVSKKLLQKVRLWLRQSNSTNMYNYMGTILSMFINTDIGKSDMKIKWKTKWLKVKDLK